MLDKNNLYLIISIIIVFCILYMIFLLLLNMIDRKIDVLQYNRSQINQPNQSSQVGLDRFNFNKENFSSFINSSPSSQRSSPNIDFSHSLTKTKSIDKDIKYETDILNGLSGSASFDNEPYYLKNKNTVINHKSDNEVCYNRHVHNSDGVCSYGKTNYPCPNTMNAMDKKIFKSFYQDGMTLQDYINWLQLHDEDGENIKLDYEHMKYYKSIKKGIKLKYIKGICPPNAKKINKVKDSAEFYQNLYQEDIENEMKNNKCANINFSKLLSQSGMELKSQIDLSSIQNANETHAKSIQGANYDEYSAMNQFDTLPPLLERKGKVNVNAIKEMTQPKLSNKIVSV